MKRSEVKLPDFTSLHCPKTTSECVYPSESAFVKASSRGAKVFAIVLVVSGIFASILTTYDSLADYFEDYSYTITTVKRVPFMEFPAVYICPHDPDAFNNTFVEDDLRKRLPDLRPEEARLLKAYAVVGSGMFNAVSVLSNSSEEDLRQMKDKFLRWLSGRTLHDFYSLLFIDNSYSCEQMFVKCSHGAIEVPCCKLFRSANMVARGPCCQLQPLQQTAPNFSGQLSLTLRSLPSWIVSPDGYQQLYVVHIISPGIEPFFLHQRYFVGRNTSNQFALKKRSYKFLSSHGNCKPGRAGNGTSRSICYYDHWHRTRLVKPFNCTFFYLKRGVDGRHVCEPGVIIDNHMTIFEETLSGSNCVPFCERSDREVLRRTKYDYFSNPSNKLFAAFRESRNGNNSRNLFGALHIYYADLEYEHIEEVLATGFSQFISELGGQSALFVGSSLLTLVQGVLSVVGYLGTWISAIRRRPILHCFCITIVTQM